MPLLRKSLASHPLRLLGLAYVLPSSLLESCG